MATAKVNLVRKHFRLDSKKSERAQKVLQAHTENETVVRALDLAIDEYERSRRATKANRRFPKSGIRINDAFGAIDC